MAQDDPGAEIAGIFRQEYGRAVAVLTRSFGSIDLAEDAVQDAFTAALERWPAYGVPPSPAGWIITTARNRAIDRVRREASRDDRQAKAVLLQEVRAGPSTAGYLESLPLDERPEDGPVSDDRLRLIFTCCHPALNPAARVALTLRLLGGLGSGEIARAFLVPEATMAQRLVRAKAKIRDAKIPYRVPPRAELPGRLQSVLAVVYLIFNEGYSPSSGPGPIRTDLCAEAVRLGRLLVSLLPDEAEARGLLALMLLADSRRAARLDPALRDADGGLVLLDNQDRRLWNRQLIAEGQELVRQCLRQNRPGPYQLQAAINAVHSDAADATSTDWGQILKLYDQLLTVAPGPVPALNRAVAVGELYGPEEALLQLKDLGLDNFYLFHAIRAHFLRRLGRSGDAAAEYRSALKLAGNEADRTFLAARLRALGISPPATE